MQPMQTIQQKRPLSSRKTLPKVAIRKTSVSSNITESEGNPTLNNYQKQYELIKDNPQETEQFFKQLNQYAMKLLDKLKSQEMSIIILSWIIEHAKQSNSHSQLCLALNNLGCAYRRMGKIQLSCNTLEQAYELISVHIEIKQKTITYINLTAVLSQMGMHERALKCAKLGAEAGKAEFNSNDLLTVKYTAMAFFNLAIELETMNRLEEAVGQFKLAVQFAEDHLGEKDPLSQKFRQSYRNAKQQLIVLTTQQTEQTMRQMLIQKKQFESDESQIQQQIPMQQTKKNFVIRKNNFVEDQMTDSKLTLKNQPIGRLDGKNSLATTIKRGELEELGIEDWSNSEPSDRDVKRKKQSEPQISMKLQPLKSQNKDQRMNFLNKINGNQQQHQDTHDKEQQIIREVEGLIYNAKNIKVIQAQFRMKQERKRFLKIKQKKKEEGSLLPSDELKLKKFQRFVRRKLAQWKIRSATRRLIAQMRLKKYPNKEKVAGCKVIALLEGKRVYEHSQLMKQALINRQYKIIRQSIFVPIFITDSIEREGTIEEAYNFNLSLQHPDQATIKFTLTPVDSKLRKDSKNRFIYETDIQSFLNCLGLMQQYIDQLECYRIEENALLKNLKLLQEMSMQFVYMSQVDGKYVVRNSTETPEQFIRALERISTYLQELTVIEDNKLIIRGFNNFEYVEVVPIQEIDDDLIAPLYLQLMDEAKINQIKKIQSSIRGFLSRKKIDDVINRTRRIVYYQQLLCVKDEYFQIFKVIDRKSQKKYIYCIDLIKKKKTNDLLIHPIVFNQIGEITAENINTIFTINFQAGLLDYSEEAHYWIQKHFEKTNKKKQSQFSSHLEEAALIIQRMMLKYLMKRRTQISKSYQNRNNNNISTKQTRREILVRRAILYGDAHNSKACLTTFYLFIEKADPNTNIMEQNEYQSIMIASKFLEHIYAFDKVQPYFQRLFYALERSNLLTIAQRMVDYSKIVRAKKEGFRVQTKNLDEVQGELMNLDEEDKSSMKDITLVARMKINYNLQQKYLKKTEQFYEGDPELVYNLGGDQNKQTNFVKIIQYHYKRYLRRLELKLGGTKHVDNNDFNSISNYVKNFLPTTEYGAEVQQVQKPKPQIEVKSQQQVPHMQLPRKSLLMQESISLFNDQVIIDNEEMRIQILYSETLDQMIILGEIPPHNQFKTAIKKEALLGDNLINFVYLQENVAGLVLQQLHFKNGVLYYEVNEEVRKEFLKEYAEFAKSESSKSPQYQSAPRLPSENVLPPELIHLLKLGSFLKNHFQLDYYYNKTAKTIAVMIESKIHKDKMCLTIDTSEFGSNFIDKTIPQQSDIQIRRFFHEFINSLNRLLVINEDLTTNFDQIRIQLPAILQERFVQKIQGMLLVRKMVEKLKMYKKLKQPKLFMHKYIENSNQHYVEIIYFLHKANYELRINIRELTFVTAQGHIVERTKTITSKRRLREKRFSIQLKNLKDISMGQSHIRRQENLEFQRIDYNNLAEYDQMKTIEYYRQMVTPLINIIQKNLVIHFSRFEFEFNINLPIKELKISLKRKKTVVAKRSFKSIVECASKLQSAYKRMKHKEWFELKLVRQQELDKQNKFIGEFIKRGFKLIDTDEKQCYYLVNTYQKNGKTVGSLKLTYELILEDKSERRKSRIRGSYIWEPSQMLNLGQTKLCDYILDLLYVDQGIIRFRESSLGYHMQEEFNIQEQKQIKSQFIEEDVEEKLVAHEENGQSLYNVIYTGNKTLKDRKQIDQLPNSVTLEVNLKSVRKLYPNMNVRNPDTMKIISQNLISGIKVNQGNLQVDQSRIQSSFINVQSQILEKRKLSSRIMRPTKPHIRIDLIKTTVTYAGEKYLIVLYYLERKITKILQSNHDKVFQEYERIFQVQATNLNQLINPIIWEFSLEEGQILTHEQQKEQIALVMSKRMQVLNGKFIYLCFNDEDLLKIQLDADSKVILFVEKTVTPIQTRFRNRKLKSNYKYYRMTLQQYKDENGQFTNKVAVFDIRSLNTKKYSFIVLFVEDEHKKLQVMAWDFLEKFYMLQLEIPKQRFISMLLDDKIKCMRALINFVTYNSDINKLIFSVPKPEILQDYFDEEKRQASFHQSSSLMSPKQEDQFFLEEEGQVALSSSSPSPLLNQVDLDKEDELIDQ